VAALAASRLLLLALAALAMLPLQLLAVRRGWTIAARIPVVFHRLALWALRVRVTEKGIAEPRRPLLMAGNHVSWLDIVVYGSRFPLSFVAKSEVAGWPVFGLLARLQRTVFVERERRARTGEATGAIAGRLAAGDAIVLFAEGTTSDNRTVLPFLTALFGAAGGVGLTVQPVAIAYTAIRRLPIERRLRPHVAWLGGTTLLPHLWALARMGGVDVTLHFLPPLEVADRKATARAAEAAVRRAVADITSGSVMAPPSAPPILNGAGKG
jgi:1-acyl-sn-glycerol-3-phosphate acyltransferase